MSKILLKEIISLKTQKEVYLVQDDEGAFCTAKKNIQKYSLTLQCRRKSCNKLMRLNPIKMSGKIPSNISTAKFSANDINKRDYDAYLQQI